MFLEWENNSRKLQIISGKFQNNAINDVKQISLSHVVRVRIATLNLSKLFYMILFLTRDFYYTGPKFIRICHWENSEEEVISKSDRYCRVFQIFILKYKRVATNTNKTQSMKLNEARHNCSVILKSNHSAPSRSFWGKSFILSGFYFKQLP